MDSENTTFEEILAKSSACEKHSRRHSIFSKQKEFVDVEIEEKAASPWEATSIGNLYQAPTAEERATLRKVCGRIPATAWLLCLVELAERASYYGSSVVYSNFLQFPLPEGGNGAGAPPRRTQKTAGALGKGLQFANALILTFKVVAYITPILGAWLADAHIGRYRAIILGTFVCGIAHLLQILGALPFVLQSGKGLPPFLTSALLLAIGAGIFRPSILPTVLDQYTNQSPYMTTLKTGEKVIVDPETTINRITLYFYAFVNVGALFPIATVYAEKLIGFWLAFILTGIVYLALPLLLIICRKRIIRALPKGSEISDFFTVIATAFHRRRGRFWTKGFLDSAKPSVMRTEGYITLKGRPIPWNDRLVDDVRNTLTACTMFLYFPIWYMNDGGIGGLATSQASTLRTDGAPNDLMNNFNPITVMIMVPLLTHIIYPALRRVNLMPRHVTRIAFGFLLSALSSMTGFIIQFYIYRTSPCGKYATHCDVGAGVSPISVWAQVPVFVLGAMSECFCQVTAFEIAYARSPKSMKAIVMSIFLLMNAVSSTLGTALTPVIRDPYLPYVWASPGLLIVVLAMHFYWRYHWMNSDEFITYEEEGRSQYESTEELPSSTVKLGAVTPYGGIFVPKKEELSCRWARDNQDEEAVRGCRGSCDAAISSCGLARQDLRQ